MLVTKRGDGFRFVGDWSSHGAYGHDLVGGVGWDRNLYLRGKFKGDWGRLSVRAFGDYNDDRNGGALLKLLGLTPAVVNSAVEASR